MGRYNTKNVETEVVYATPDANGVRDLNFVKAEFIEPTATGSGSVRFTFAQEKSGALAFFQEYELDETRYSASKVFTSKKGDEDKAGRTELEKAYSDQNAKIIHVLGAITGIDYSEVDIDAESFEEYVNALLKTIDVEKAKAVKIDWIKLIYYTKQNGEQRVTTPTYPPFISSELKPRKWEVSDWERTNKVFYKKTTVQQIPDTESDNSYSGNDDDDSSDTDYGDDDVV